MIRSLRKLPALLLFLFCFAPVRADLRREVEPNDAPSTAQSVLPTLTVGGCISAPGDRDVYAFREPAGGTVQAVILARGLAGSSPLTAVLKILASDGTTVLAQDQSQGETDDPAVSVTVGPAGVYFVSVEDLDALGGTDFDYLLSIEAEGNGGFGSATQIVPPVIPSLDATIWPAGDRDFYRFAGQAGQVVTLDLASAVFNPITPPIEGVLTLYDSNHVVLATDSYSVGNPTDPLIQFSLLSTGTYFVEVREVRGYVGNPLAFYQLDVHLGPSPQNDTPGTAIPLIVPRGVSGTICPAGGQDEYSFGLALPGTLSLDTDAAQDLQSLLQGTVAALSPVGTVLASDASIPDPSLALPLSAGPYVASISGTSSGLCQEAYYQYWIDGDLDGDGIRLPADRCPLAYNPAQEDTDHDGVGDACDVCIAVFNPGQEKDLRIQAPVGDSLSLSPDSSGTLLQWTPAPGSVASNVYRATPAAPGGAPPSFSCLGDNFTDPTYLDPDLPLPGQVYFYLITGENCGESGGGFDSGGQPRQLSPCPASI